MVFCHQCGTKCEDSARFCPSCGTTLPAQAEALTSVTSAVRNYAASASQEERDKKYGQQQWGLFETDSQRRRNITTEQSLQEIEDFSRNGVTMPPSGVDTVHGAGSRGPALPPRDAAGSAGSAGQYGSAAGGPGGAGGFGSAGNGSAAEFDSRGRAAGSGTGSFPTGANTGASFFAQHQQREAAKYKPGYKGKLDQ
eukprot:m51a1_g2979 hypothetical protein (196) ;mRNA; f:717412-718258